MNACENSFPKNEGVQTTKISTYVTCGLNNPEACYQSLHVILFRQVSSYNRISQKSIWIIFFWVCAVRLLLKEVKLYIIHLFNGEPQKQFNYGVSQICTWSYGPWKDTSLLSLLLHVWKCSEKNLLRLHRGSIPFTYVAVRLTCCDLWPCYSSYALNLWGNRCNCRRFVINPRYQITTMRKIGGSVKV